MTFDKAVSHHAVLCRVEPCRVVVAVPFEIRLCPACAGGGA